MCGICDDRKTKCRNIEIAERDKILPNNLYRLSSHCSISLLVSPSQIKTNPLPHGRGFYLRLIGAYTPIACQYRQLIAMWGGIGLCSTPAISNDTVFAKGLDVDRICLVSTEHHQVTRLISPHNKAHMTACTFGTATPKHHHTAIGRFIKFCACLCP